MTTPSLTEINLEDLHPHPSNVRDHVDDLDELAASIAEQGILQPLVAAPHPDKGDGSYVLIAGHRRHAAAERAGLQTVPVLVRADLTDPAAQLSAMLVENGRRKDLTILEEARGYQALMTFDGWDAKKVGRTVGHTPTLVRERVKLLDASTKVQGLVSSGQVTIADALAVAALPQDLQAAAEVYMGTPQQAWQLERARNQAKRREAVAAAVEDAEAAGVPVVRTDARLDIEFDYMHEDELGSVLGIDAADEDFAGEGGQDRFEAAVAAAHRDCPGRALLVSGDEWSGYICRQDGLHDAGSGDLADLDPEAKAAAEAAAAAQAAAEAERQQVLLDLEAAAGVRADWLHGQFNAATKDHSIPELALRDTLDALVRHRQLYLDTWSTPSTVRLLARAITGQPDSEMDLSALIRATIDQPLPQRTLLLAWIYLASPLDQPYQFAVLSGARWVAYLDEAGYPWTDAERRHLPAADEDDADENDPTAEDES